MHGMWEDVGPGGVPSTHLLLALSCLPRYLEFYPMVLVGVLALLPMLVMLIVVYGFWKKRHMGSE